MTLSFKWAIISASHFRKDASEVSSYVLSCCSVVDLNTEYVNKRNISFVPLHYFVDGVEFADDMGATMTSAEFYQMMRDGAEVSTSQVNVDEFTKYFEPFLAAGQDVIHIALSSGLSGTYNSARIAAELLAEKYPERKLYVIDSLAASAGGGLLLDTMADMRDNGATIDELYQWTENNKRLMHHWFTASDLTWFIKGGRVTKAAGWFGTVLKICPVLNVDFMGRLIPRFKIRGKNNALRELVNQMKEHARDGKNYSGKCFISNSACYEDARAVADEIEAYFPNLNGKVEIYNIGTTIGSHCGPGTTALFFWGDERTN